MIYVDSLKNNGWVLRGRHIKNCHLYGDSNEELINFAEKIGLNKEWMQKSRSGIRHFDITAKFRKKAIEIGAVEIRGKEFIKRILNRNYLPI